MSAGNTPEFKAGEPCRAADFDALVQAVRGLMVQQGLLTVTRKGGRVMRSFARGGSCIARAGDDGKPIAMGAEILWQVGPHVALLQGGAVEGVAEALEAADAAGVPTGLHADVSWVRVQTPPGNTYAATLEAASVTWSAAPWLDPVEGEDGETVWYYHGGEQAGCVLPVAGHRHQPQRAVAMWPMPQRVLLIGRQDSYLEAGCIALLPAPTCTQALARQYGGYYTGGGEFVPVYHQWLARLDKHGRLQFAAGNLNT